jgi:hypothetical protein
MNRASPSSNALHFLFHHKHVFPFGLSIHVAATLLPQATKFSLFSHFSKFLESLGFSLIPQTIPHQQALRMYSRDSATQAGVRINPPRKNGD